MFSTYHYSSPIKPVNTGHLCIHRRCCEKLTTLSNGKNTMWKKLCPQLSVAEKTTNESYTSSNDMTIRNVGIERRNHSTTSQ